MRWVAVLILFMLVKPAYALTSIGEVTEQIGDASITTQDGDTKASAQGEDVKSMDTIRTAVGRTAIEFVDNTRVDVTENSKLVIDEFIYDPNTSTGKLALKASFGTVRYASGQIAKNSRQNVQIRTPTAVIGVRGTDFSMTVDETGNSTIILLPSCTGIGSTRICVVGEIEVSSDIGTVILNQAFQATVVETAKSQPFEPLKLDIDESLIGNLLIVRKPLEIEEEEERLRAKKLADFLGFDFLEFEELDRDYLTVEDSEWQTDLDFDPLAQDYLKNVLDMINEALTRLMASALSSSVKGTQLGIDPETQIGLFDQEPDWVIRREDGLGNFFELRLNKSYGYNINMQQGDFEYRDYQLGDGQNEIDIVQTQ